MIVPGLTGEYKTFDFNAFGQGEEPLTLLPDGNTGNYFADTRRSSRRLQLQETYFAHPFSFRGQHSIKLGAEFNRTNMSGVFSFRPILIRRGDQTLSQRIDFTGPTFIDRSLMEFGAFAQDRWVINRSLTVDAGLRLDRDSITSAINFRLAWRSCIGRSRTTAQLCALESASLCPEFFRPVTSIFKT